VERYAVRKFPTNVWIDREGRVVDFSVGAIRADDLEKKVRELVGTK
jgi:hypothetical protein